MESATNQHPTTIAVSQRSGRALRVLWPLLAFLLAQVLLALLVAPVSLVQLVPGPVVLVGALLFAGLLPALLRPSVTSGLVGCLAVALVGVLLRMPNLSSITSLNDIAPALDSTDLKIMLFNIVLLAPLTLHLSAFFPQRTNTKLVALASYYALTVGLALLVGLTAIPLRQVVLAALLTTTYAGFGVAAYQFLRTIRTVQPTNPQAAQQGRVLLVSLALAEAPFLLMPIGQFIRLLVPYELVIGAQIILPLGIAYGVLRTDLFGVDVALRRTLDYAAVSFGLLIIYFGVTALLTQISGNLGGIWGLVGTVVSVMAAAAAFTPLRRMCQRLIDQAFYPERLRFGQTISAARTRLAQVVQREAVVLLLEAELPQQLGASWAKLALRPAFDLPTSGNQSGAWNTLLTVGGQPLGSYWLGPRQPGLGYDAAEQEQLSSLLQQAALALAYAETFDSLAELNRDLEERVATRTEHVLAQQRELAAFEERQRLARDLHDSVKQTLFSLGLGLRSARSRVRSDPDAAETLLHQHEQTAIQAQAELSDMVTHLRTPAAGSADLVTLLEQHAASFAQHGLHVALTLPRAAVLPQPLPSELGQVAKEALHNVLRHSGEKQAQLTLLVEGEVLELIVRDHGRGFDTAAQRRGHGLRGIHERLTALDGTLELASTHEGTTLCAKIPLAQPLHQ